MIGNVVEGMTNNNTSSTKTNTNVVLYGPDGGTATIISDKNTVSVTTMSGSTTSYSYKSTTSTSTFSTKTYEDSTGNKAVVVSNASGPVVAQISTGTNTNPVMYYPNDEHSGGSDTKSTVAQNTEFNVFYAKNGNIARLISGDNTDLLVITQKSSGDVELFHMNPGSGPNKQFFGPNGQVALYSTVDGKQQIELTNANQTSYVFSLSTTESSNSSSITKSSNTTTSQPEPMTTSSSLNNSSIQQSVYPTNQDDLYILKSSVVPPVCPKCPQPIIQCGDSSNDSKHKHDSKHKKNDSEHKGCKSKPYSYSTNYSGAGM